MPALEGARLVFPMRWQPFRSLRFLLGTRVWFCLAPECLRLLELLYCATRATCWVLRLLLTPPQISSHLASASLATLTCTFIL